MTFAPNWQNIQLSLPAHLNTESLPPDYVEILQKIRSTPCTRCDEKERGPCTQESTGRATWKCTTCLVKHRSKCTWMTGEWPFSTYCSSLTCTLDCEKYGLRKIPAISHNPPARSATADLPPSNLAQPPATIGAPSTDHTRRKSTRIADRPVLQASTMNAQSVSSDHDHVRTDSKSSPLDRGQKHVRAQFAPGNYKCLHVCPLPGSADHRRNICAESSSPKHASACVQAEAGSSGVSSTIHWESNSPARAQSVSIVQRGARDPMLASCSPNLAPVNLNVPANFRSSGMHSTQSVSPDCEPEHVRTLAELQRFPAVADHAHSQSDSSHHAPIEFPSLTRRRVPSHAESHSADQEHVSSLGPGEVSFMLLT